MNLRLPGSLPGVFHQNGELPDLDFHIPGGEFLPAQLDRVERSGVWRVGFVISQRARRRFRHDVHHHLHFDRRVGFHREIVAKFIALRPINVIRCLDIVPICGLDGCHFQRIASNLNGIVQWSYPVSVDTWGLAGSGVRVCRASYRLGER